MDGIKVGEGISSFDISMCEKLDEHIEKNPNIRLVIIDPIAAYVGDIDDNSDSGVRQALQPLSDMAMKRRLAIIILKHVKKGEDHADHKALGSVAWRNLPRMVWYVRGSRR